MGLCHRAGEAMRRPAAAPAARLAPRPSRCRRSPEQLAGARPTLPPGATWGLLTAGTSLDGLPYPLQSEEQA